MSISYIGILVMVGVLIIAVIGLEAILKAEKKNARKDSKHNGD